MPHKVSKLRLPEPTVLAAYAPIIFRKSVQNLFRTMIQKTRICFRVFFLQKFVCRNSPVLLQVVSGGKFRM